MMIFKRQKGTGTTRKTSRENNQKKRQETEQEVTEQEVTGRRKQQQKSHKQKKPYLNGMALYRRADYRSMAYLITLSSTRRFSARPLAVSLEATGFASPKPVAFRLLALTPLPIR